MKGSPELGGPFVSYGVWLRQMDLIRGSARYGVALVHYGLLSVGSPHSSASQPPSPQGKALGGTMYHKKVQYFKFVPRCQSLPLGGRCPSAHTGADEGYVLHGIGRVPTYPRTPRKPPSNPSGGARLHLSTFSTSFPHFSPDPANPGGLFSRDCVQWD